MTPPQPLGVVALHLALRPHTRHQRISAFDLPAVEGSRMEETGRVVGP